MEVNGLKSKTSTLVMHHLHDHGQNETNVAAAEEEPRGNKKPTGRGLEVVRYKCSLCSLRSASLWASPAANSLNFCLYLFANAFSSLRSLQLTIT